MRLEPDIKGPENVGSYCANCDAAATFYLMSPTMVSVGGKKIDFFPGHCSSCDFPSVFSRPHVYEGENHHVLVRQFPPSRTSISCELPEETALSFQEAVRCEEARAWIACVVMVGRALESVCKEHFPTESKLTVFSGIKKLHDEGIISDQIKEWADELRILRNIGAHASGHAVSKDDARESLDFLKAILENVYDLSPKFRQFKTRRNAEQGAS